MLYGYWRTDKPKEKGFSHEFISSDTAQLIRRTEATLDTLSGLEQPGVDTLYKAFKRNVRLMPDKKWLGTRVGDKYEWMTLNEAAVLSENLSHGFRKLGLVPEINIDTEQWKFMGI